MSREDGDIYEQQVEEICRALGYQVIAPPAGNNKDWDRIVNGLRVQIKKRSVDTTKPNCIRLVTNLSSAAVVYAANAVDAFVIWWGGRWYVIPSAAMADSNGDIRNGVYMPAYDAYVRRWDALAGARVEHDVQTVMF